ncbi:MAG: CHAT domain-containing protein [Ignavibacteriales bacterium]|nr:CHAT domain-containing protein [Ignavibacteriales bacterium]
MRNFGSLSITFFTLLVIQTGISQNSVGDTLQARQLFATGLSQFETMSFDSSIESFSRSSNIWLRNLNWKEYVASERNIVECYIRQGKTEKAFTEIVRIDSIILQKEETYQSDKIRVPVLKSYLQTTFGKNDEALQTINSLILRFPKLENEVSVDGATVFYTIGNIYSAKNIFDSAIYYFEKTEHIRKQLFGEDHLSLSRIYFSLGNSYSRKNDFNIALAYYRRSLNILDKNNLNLSDDAGYCHLYIMSSLIDMGDYDKAIEHGNKSIEIYSKLNLPEHGVVAGALGKLGEIYVTLGDLEKAKDYTQRSLDLNMSKYPQSISSQAAHTQRLADIYRRMGDLDKALEYTVKGIALTEQSYGKDHPQAGFMYELSAGVYTDRKEFTKAIEYYQKALTNRLSVGARESYGDVVAIYTSMSSVYLQMKKPDLALNSLKQAEEFESRSIVKNIPQKGLLLQRFGEYYEARGKYADALASYSKGLNLLSATDGENTMKGVGDVRKSMYKKEAYGIVMRMADLYQRRFTQKKNIADLQQSLAFYTTAMDLVDDIRREYSTDGSKFILADQSKLLYSKTCRIALKLFALTKDREYQEQAFLATDRSKANALMEQLFDREAKHFAGIPDSLLQQENNLLSSIASHEIRIQKQDGHGGNNDLARQKLQAELFGLKMQHQKLVEYLELQYPQYHTLKYADYTMTVSDIRKGMGSDDVLIEYLFDGPAVHAFALTENDLVSTTIPAYAKIDRTVEQFSSSLKKYEVGPYHTSGQHLYAYLLKPFEKVLSGKKLVTIIPDGMLHYVPFEALPARRYISASSDFTSIPYLIRYYDVRYSYSAAFHARMNNEINVAHNNVLTDMSFAGFAPVFRDSTKNGDFLANRSFVEESGLSDVRSITLDGKTFNELKYSEEELLSIGNSFRSHSMPFKNFLHTSATETNFKLFSSKYDVVHVATHGFVNEKNPKLSAILFSQPNEQSATDDGILYLNEAFALDLKAKLVVLSSCESGLGTLVQGEGMMALTRGLFYAGAKNIVFSLWKVSDKQTYLLMDEFYKQMLSGRSYSSSLRQAKLKMIAAQESAFPSKWSGFVLIGE